MRVIGLIQDHDGAVYHRIYLPLMLMPDVDCYLTNILTEEQLEKGCDVLYVNRLAPHNNLPDIERWRKKYGFKLVVDMDDYWHLDPHHLLYDIWKEGKIAERIEGYITKADYVTCTHERLREVIRPLNKKVLVLPNAIPNIGQFKIERSESYKVRLFWAGSVTHQKDVELLRGPMKRISGELAEKIQIVMGGYNHSDVWGAMVSSFTNGLTLPPVLHKGTSPAGYYHIYKECDIAIVPLVDSRFNSFKSNLKVLEAAHAFAPVIVSDVHPYKDFPKDLICPVASQKDWYRHIKLLVKNAWYREELGRLLNEYCAEHFNFDTINTERKQLLESLCNSPILIS